LNTRAHNIATSTQGHGGDICRVYLDRTQMSHFKSLATRGKSTQSLFHVVLGHVVRGVQSGRGKLGFEVLVSVLNLTGARRLRVTVCVCVWGGGGGGVGGVEIKKLKE
jgi:hypothetical protein